MQGQGITNYSLDKPSYAFSTATTEFDDALIRRGVISLEQAMMAKGACESEAHRLAAHARSGTEASATTVTTENANNHEENNDNSDTDYDDDDDDDDDFLQKYREQRLAQIKQEHQAANNTTKRRYYGDVIPIQRPEWIHHVNESSHESWVVVTLTSSHHSELTAPMEAAVRVLALKCPRVKFVTIPSKSAIADNRWPDANLPSVFVYRHGKMTRQLVQMNRRVAASPILLLQELAEAGVEFDEDDVHAVQEYDAKLQQEKHNNLRQHMKWHEDEDGDDDEVK